MQYKTKNKGISILIAMGGSFLVLMMAFATLLSIQKMLAQVEGLERSTRLFFAAESGIEAAFYHHNARGAGVEFTTTDSSQEILHLNSSITSKWTIDGRTNLVGSDYPMIGLLKEGQTIQIPLYWDSASNPSVPPSITKLGGGGTTDYFRIEFYEDSDDMIASEKSIFESKFGNRVAIPSGFDFGDDGDGDDTDGDSGATGSEILIDWSLARTNSSKGIQTFSPKNNDCTTNEDFACEDRMFSGASDTPTETITAETTIRQGRVLPGYVNTTVNINDFIRCIDAAAAGGNCEKYVLSFRSLLKFKSSVDGSKIPGIPYIVRVGDGSTKYAIPKQTYTVTSTVNEGDFSQTISLDIPEKTTIGAFDYVIFD